MAGVDRSADFFGCFATGLVERHKPRMRRLFAAVVEAVAEADPSHRPHVVWCFGELFGGGYTGLQTQQHAVLVQA